MDPPGGRDAGADGTFRAVQVTPADDETIACEAFGGLAARAGIGTDRASTLRDERREW